MTHFKRYSILSLAAAALSFSLAPDARAQSPAGAIITLVMPAGSFGSDRFTDLMVNSLAGARGFCGALGKAYQVDCLAERISNLSNQIPSDTDYGEVKQILNQTAQDMNRLARANRDVTLPRQNASTSGQSTTRPLTPVSEDRLAEISQQAAAILERTETLLLRTPDEDSGKKLHYTRIAQAIGSNKTLLRSA